MIDGLRILAIIPARGGSKGIPLKNLLKINGKSLIKITAEVVSQLPIIDRVVVSSDHAEIINEAKMCGVDAPFVRPRELSGDFISDWKVLNHALLEVEKLDQIKYDIIIMLQPTSPLRTAEDISGAIKLLLNSKYDSVWSVSVTDSKAHPLKQLEIKNNLLNYWDKKGGEIIARQQLDCVYHRNGVVYAITRECLLDQKTIKGARTGGYIIERENVSIDTLDDVERVMYILQKMQTD